MPTIGVAVFGPIDFTDAPFHAGQDVTRAMQTEHAITKEPASPGVSQAQG